MTLRGGKQPRRGKGELRGGESDIRARWDQLELKEEKRLGLKKSKQGDSLEWDCTWLRGPGQDTERKDKSEHSLVEALRRQVS